MDNDTTPNNSKSLIQVSDLFGISKAADRLAEGIVRGVGNFLLPWQHKRVQRAEINAFKSWESALQSLNLPPRLADLTLQQRASVRLQLDNTERQQNRENVAFEAIQEFQSESGYSQVDQNQIEPDWINRFWRLAENVNDARMQGVWGRVLAQRAKNRGAFGVRALEALSLLSFEEAMLLENIATVVISKERNQQAISIIATSVRLSHDHSTTSETTALKKELASHVSERHSAIFGPAGIYLDSGGTSWAYNFYFDLAQPSTPIIIGGKRYFVKCSDAMLGKKLDFSGVAVSPLGNQLIGLIEATPKSAYVETLSKLLSLMSLELSLDEK